MDREILFRGKRLDNGEWIYGFVLVMPNTNTVKILVWCKSYVANGDGRQEFDVYDVDPSTVGRYTGLTDKDGKRIFEGDIVRWIWEPYALIPPGGYCRYLYGTEFEVRFLESGFMLCRVGDQMPNIPNANGKVANYEFWKYHKGLEIIGNVHDKEQRDQ